MLKKFLKTTSKVFGKSMEKCQCVQLTYVSLKTWIYVKGIFQRCCKKNWHLHSDPVVSTLVWKTVKTRLLCSLFHRLKLEVSQSQAQLQSIKWVSMPPWNTRPSGGILGRPQVGYVIHPVRSVSNPGSHPSWESLEIPGNPFKETVLRPRFTPAYDGL